MEPCEPFPQDVGEKITGGERSDLEITLRQLVNFLVFYNIRNFWLQAFGGFNFSF